MIFAHLLNQVSDSSDFKRTGRLHAFHLQINGRTEPLRHVNALSERRVNVKSLHLRHDDDDDDDRQTMSLRKKKTLEGTYPADPNCFHSGLYWTVLVELCSYCAWC